MKVHEDREVGFCKLWNSSVDPHWDLVMCSRILSISKSVIALRKKEYRNSTPRSTIWLYIIWYPWGCYGRVHKRGAPVSIKEKKSAPWKSSNSTPEIPDRSGVYLQYRLRIHCWHTADSSVHCVYTVSTLYIHCSDLVIQEWIYTVTCWQYSFNVATV